MKNKKSFTQDALDAFELEKPREEAVYTENKDESIVFPQEIQEKNIRREKLVQRSHYITERQAKALKLRAALSDDPNEKDQSAIVRVALDRYLADTLKEV